MHALRVSIGFVVLASVSLTFAGAAAPTLAAGPITSASLTGGTGTAVVGGTLFAQTGAALNLTVVTDASTYCVKLSGAHVGSSDAPSNSDESTKVWTFALTALGGGDGVRVTTVTASYNAACTTNNGSTTVSYTVDNAPPTTSASSATDSGGTMITVALVATDAASGVQATRFRLDGGTTKTYDQANPPTFSSQGSHSLEYWSVDNVGNSEAHQIFSSSGDSTPPSVSVAQSPPANGNGWNNSSVTVTFTCSDAGSGVASCPAPVTVSAEGANQAVSGTSVDNAGNSASATAYVAIDRTSPSVAVTGVTAGGTYVQGSWSAGCSTTDSLSGVATAASLATAGGPTGQVTLTCSGASDRAGNSQSTPARIEITVTESTGSGTFQFGGFLPPVAGDGALNRVRSGAPVLVRFSLGGFHGMHIFASGYPASVASTCSGAPPTAGLESVDWPWGVKLWYNHRSDTYGFDWYTSSRWSGCRTMVLKFSDGSTQVAYFDFVGNRRHHHHH